MDYNDPDDLDFIPAPSPEGRPSQTPTLSVIERYFDQPIDEIPLADRIDLYEALKSALPPHKLQDLDLAQELVLQFMRVKELQTSTLNDGSVKANQKAQVANSVAAILGQLTKLQVELHSAERIKLLETHLIKILKDFPDLSAGFLSEYERSLEAL